MLEENVVQMQIRGSISSSSSALPGTGLAHLDNGEFTEVRAGFDHGAVAMLRHGVKVVVTPQHQVHARVGLCKFDVVRLPHVRDGHNVVYAVLLTQLLRVYSRGSSEHFSENISEIRRQGTIKIVPGQLCLEKGKVALDIAHLGNIPRSRDEIAVLDVLRGVGKCINPILLGQPYKSNSDALDLQDDLAFATRYDGVICPHHVAHQPRKIAIIAQLGKHFLALNEAERGLGQ